MNLALIKMAEAALLIGLPATAVNELASMIKEGPTPFDHVVKLGGQFPEHYRRLVSRGLAVEIVSRMHARAYAATEAGLIFYCQVFGAKDVWTAAQQEFELKNRPVVAMTNLC